MCGSNENTWDLQIEKDAVSGRLNPLFEEVAQDISEGKTTDLNICAQCNQLIDPEDYEAVVYVLRVDNEGTEPFERETICGSCWTNRNATWKGLTASISFLGPRKLYKGG